MNNGAQASHVCARSAVWRHARRLLCAVLAAALLSQLAPVPALGAQAGEENVFAFHTGAGGMRAQYGLMDVSGRVLVSAQYEYMEKLRGKWYGDDRDVYYGVRRIPAKEDAYSEKDRYEYDVYDAGGKPVLQNGVGYLYACGAEYMVNNNDDRQSVLYDRSGKRLGTYDQAADIQASRDGYVVFTKDEEGTIATVTAYNKSGIMTKTFTYARAWGGAWDEDGYLLNICVSNGTNTGLVDTAGQVLIPLKYAGTDTISVGKGVVLARSQEGLQGVLRMDGTTLVPFAYHEIRDLSPKAFVGVRGDGKSDVYDGSGKLLLKGSEDELRIVTCVDEEADARALVMTFSPNQAFGAPVKRAFFSDGSELPQLTGAGFVDWASPKMIQYSRSAQDASANFLRLDDGSTFACQASWYTVCSDDVIIAAVQAPGAVYDYNYTLYDGRGKPLTQPYDYMENPYYYGSGYAKTGPLVIGMRGKQPGSIIYGLMDRAGKVCLTPQFNTLSPILPGVFYARRGSRMGYVTDKGEWLYQSSLYQGGLWD